MSCQVTFPLQDIVLLLRDKINPEIIGAVPEEKLEEEVLLFIQPKIDELQEQLSKLPPEVHIVTQILEGTSLKTTLNNGKVLSSDLSPLFVKFDGLVSLYEKNVAAGAGKNGWDANLVAYGETTQKQINDGLDSVAAMLAIKNPRNGQRVYVKSYHAGLSKGGGTFVYDSTKANINDGGTVINGWVRQINKSTITPEMFGAKGGLTQDDADSIRKCILSARDNKIRMILFSQKYLIDSPRIVGQETLLELIPNCNFIGIGGAELVVGDNIPDKFHILAAVNYIITTEDVGNTTVGGIKFSALSSAANMSAYTSNIAIHTFGLNNVLIYNCTYDKLDLANVIASGIHYENVLYGSKVTISNNKFLATVANNPINIDHSSIYMEAPDSFVIDNLFRNSSHGKEVGCAIEVHASNVLVKGNQVFNYSRMGWLAAAPITIENVNFIDNICFVSNHAVILTASQNGYIVRCNIKDNIVHCEHVTTSDNFVTYQGIAITSGILDNLGWAGVAQLNIMHNKLYIHYSKQPQFATIVNFEQAVDATIEDNTVHNAIAGANFVSFDSSTFKDNKIYNQTGTITYHKDFYLQIHASKVNQSIIADNDFKFSADNKPSYLIGLSNVDGNNLLSTTIVNNRQLSPSKPNADIFFIPSMNLQNGNILDFNHYYYSISVPSLTVGGEVAWTQSLPNNYNGCVVDLDLVLDGRFYPLVDKGIATGSNLNLRVKGLVETGGFGLVVNKVNIKTV